MSLGATLKSNCLDGAQLPIPAFKAYPQNLTAFPHTGGDFFFHIKNGKRGDVFDISSAIMESLSKYNVRFTEIGDAYAYRVGSNGLGRDLSGFEDGTQNPPEAERPIHALTSQGESFVLAQQWIHRLKSWNTIPVQTQEEIIGRTKPGSVELDPLPVGSHVSRTDIPLKMVRASMPYGNSLQNGLFFIAYAKDVEAFDVSLKRMAGIGDGVVDGIIKNLSRAVTGNYFYVPNMLSIREWASVSKK